MFSLDPTINRKPFTVEEDCMLMAYIKEYGTDYNNFPSNLLPDRNMKQIRNRYNNVLKLVKTREHWTELHDCKLIELVGKYGTTNWVKIADEMVSHSRTSCRQRYTTILKFLEKHPGKTVVDVPRRKKAFSTNVTTENWMDTIVQAKNFESINTASEDEYDEDRVKPESKQISRQSLHNSPYFEFFKYSFNFKFAEPISGSDSLFENVQTACQLLQAPPIPRAINLYDESFSSYVRWRSGIEKVQLEPALLRSLYETGRNNFLYPVNLNTILGMRGLVAMFEVPKKKKETTTQRIKCEKNMSDGHEALELFKMRFKSIFKQTADLAKLKRAHTSVSLRLESQNRKRSRPTATVTSTSTTDFHNNQTLVRVIEEPDQHEEASEQMAFESVDFSDCDVKPAKRSRVTVLESTTLTLNALKNDPLELAPASSSAEDSTYNLFRYRVQTSDMVNEINIQPYTSESETEGMVSDSQSAFSNTEFVIWTPTITDDATGTSPTKEIKPIQQNNE